MYYQIILARNSYISGNIRQLDDDSSLRIDSVAANNLPITRTVTGVTESRLEEVKSYNFQTPFIAGINGVISVNEDEIIYHIDGITYTTSLSDETTTYIFGYIDREEASATHFFYRNEHDVFIDKNATRSDILMERSEKSVFDSMLVMATVNSLDDLADFFK